MEKLLNLFGREFMTYILASDAVPEMDDLSPEQRTTVETLLQLAGRADLEPDGYARTITLAGTGKYYPASDTSIANALRMQCGGTLETIDEQDDVAGLLMQLARDVYPVLLIPRPDQEPLLSLTASIFSNPRTRETHRAILADEALVKLTPGAPPPEAVDTDAHVALNVHGYLAFSTGRGGTLQLGMLPEMILVSAYYRQLFRGPLTPPDYLQAVREVLEEIRTLASRRQVKVPMLVALGNVRLADGLKVRLGKAVLRAAGPTDRELLARIGMGVQVSAVLETTFPIKLLKVSPWAPGPADDQMPNPFEKLLPTLQRYRQQSEREVNYARYSLLLASNDDAPVAAVVISTAMLDPFETGGPSISRRVDTTYAPIPEAAIDHDLAQRAEEWARRVDRKHPANLDMSMRRLLSAVSIRLDPMDGFVDAVIAWENMFGTGEGETTFRICGAMAHLLEPDRQEDRLTLFRTLQELYKVRSSLVHGAREPDASSAGTHRDQAVLYALRAMRRLYDQPDLLSASSSSERGRNLLLHLAPTASTPTP